MKTNKPLLLVAIILMMPAIILALKQLMLKCVNVIAVCDNDKNVRMQKIGLPILSVEDAAKVYKNAIYVIANKNCAESLKNQLMSMGISEKQIVLMM